MARNLARRIRYYFGLFIIVAAFLGVIARLSWSSDLSLSIFESTHGQPEHHEAAH